MLINKANEEEMQEYMNDKKMIDLLAKLEQDKVKA